MARTKTLADDAARRTALCIHEGSHLVEAGAGAGKTAVMAGRIALMLAEGIAPKSIAAVTFTELAASELVVRVREFVNALLSENIPPEMRIGLPQGLSAKQQTNLAGANGAIDELTCSTIHGFCQRLIKPYPVEADIDPGATLMDSAEGELIFQEVFDAWLREQLSGETEGLLAAMVLQDAEATIKLTEKVAGHMRRRRTLVAPTPAPHRPLIEAFGKAVAAFAIFMKSASVEEPETTDIVDGFKSMAVSLRFASANEEPATLVRLLVAEAFDGLHLKYRKKGKWTEALKRVGLRQGDAGRLNDAAKAHFDTCAAAWTAIKEAVASRVLADLIDEVRPVIDRFQAYKRSVGLLDFDDLIFSARDLLRQHPQVRTALALRYAHLLVDEFQDTDPLQTEIFWRLCGDPPRSAKTDDWSKYVIRPGALFLVGDPKQAIYRFRGADVAAYLDAREAFKAMDAGSLLSIATNFRSRAPILTYVNARFEAELSAEGQPGFTKLDPFHVEAGGSKCVVALDVEIANEDGKASADQRRDAEAEAIALMCARLIAGYKLTDSKSGEDRSCRPGDIALLAPSGSDLWRYEIALERHRVPVATQAGKGLFQRQEVQDLIAITRVLADGRDTLALGALLRGPIVGLSEEELLDIVWALPRRVDEEDELPWLTLSVAPESIIHPLARDVIEKLQSLRSRANSTTPHEILSQAIDVLSVRPLLLARHQGQADRVLSNVDLYLTFSRAYDVRGLRAFAEAMKANWQDQERAAEGRPDAQEESVALYTMHASKGLEWPIVVPINTMTTITHKENAVIDRATQQLHCPVFGVKPAGYGDALDAERAELQRERIRLWYVATTRAREMLVIPRPSVPAGGSTWMGLVDLGVEELPALDLSHLSAAIGAPEASTQNPQTRGRFAAEASAIADLQTRLTWMAPSRDEGMVGSLRTAEPPVIVLTGEDDNARESAAPGVQGGRTRGRILHKLFEEVLTGETADAPKSLAARAVFLILELGETVADDPSEGLSAVEIAGCVSRTLSLPEIAALRPTLVPEFPVYASDLDSSAETAISGIADAIAYAPDGRPNAVIDWKSDIAPDPKLVDHYRAQVRSYLESTGAMMGLIVFVTNGNVVRVSGGG